MQLLSPPHFVSYQRLCCVAEMFGTHFTQKEDHRPLSPTRNRLTYWSKATLEEICAPGSKVVRNEDDAIYYVVRDNQPVYVVHDRTMRLFSRAGWIRDGARHGVYVATERGRSKLRSCKNIRTARNPFCINRVRRLAQCPLN